MCRRPCRAAVLVLAALLVPAVARPQTPPSPSSQSSQSASEQSEGQPPPLDVRVVVVGTTPLPGVEQPIERIPAPVQTATAVQIERSGALDVADYANRRLNGVHVNEMQGNPFQADVNYRGYTASPLLGTPQGLSVYMDGIRLNQPFGDIISWDLIPRIAIASTTLMPGSNPLFGLNTLGGALALQTKSGLAARGTTVQANYGSDARRAFDIEHGGSRPNGFHYYAAGSFYAEDGWREDSPSDVRQLFGKVGWARDARDISLTVAHANNDLNGNGLQEARLLDRDYSSIYTKPDETRNRGTFVNLALRRPVGSRTNVSATIYYRDSDTRTLNGDVNEDSLDQSLYQPSAAERAALAAAGYTGVPAAGESALNTPFPYWRCIGNVLLQDEPGEKCNGLFNRTRTSQHSAGASGQATRFAAIGDARLQLTAGGAFDRSDSDFMQSSEIGYLRADRGVEGLGVFADGVSAGDVDGEPFDTRVDLVGTVTTWSGYAAGTLSLRDRLHVTGSGRYNRTSVVNRDGIAPGGGHGSLDGDHVFQRFNPAAGITFSPAPAVNLYAGYSEGSRAATSIELGCADPDQPCKLPNAMAGDPPLKQVVTRTIDAGVRGRAGAVSWNAGVFRAANRDDILFVQAEQTGFGYFLNVDRTRRVGAELGARGRIGRSEIGGGYTWLSATFESDVTLNGESNSANDAEGPGLEGSIDVGPGDPLPLIPRHMFKAYADLELTSAFGVEVDLLAMSGAVARGNENGAHAADGVYYIGPGQTDPYAVVDLTARYAVTPWLQIVAAVNNLFDRHYATGAQLGPTAFTAGGVFVARPLPAVNGEFPLTHSTLYAPGAPARAWIGTRVRF